MPSAILEFIVNPPANSFLIVREPDSQLAIHHDEHEHEYQIIEHALSDTDRSAMDCGYSIPFLSSLNSSHLQNTKLGLIAFLDYRLNWLPLDFFNQAYERLASNALLVLAFLPENDIKKLRYLADLALRCGFQLDEQQVSIKSNTYQTLTLSRSSRPPRWRIELFHEQELAGFVDLFKESFQSDISLPLWHWKYGEGRGHGVIARRGERIIAHYGCTRRRVLYFGRPITALQMCDVMVDPRERGVMTKQGAMFLTTATMLELYLGLQPADLPFGFPSGRHERLGERLGLYAEVGRIAELRWPALPGRSHLSTRVRHLDCDDHDGNRRLITKLWETMSRDLNEAILLIRDWDYLVYRYLDHPTHHYDLILVTSRFSGKPLGLLVLRRLDDDTVELLDLIGPLDRIPVLIDQARRLAGRWGARSLFGWITRQHVEHFATPDVSITDPDVSIPTNVWVDGPAVESLKDRWWLMSGDTEFH